MESFYLGRQPILDRKRQTIAYSLMFRDEDASGEDDSWTRKSARLLVNGLMDIGLGEISNNLPIYVPVTRELLVRGTVSDFPPEMLGVAILADIETDDEVLSACASLRQQGYSVMLNGVVDTPAFHSLLKIADTVKLDINTPNVATAVEHIRPFVSTLIAGKVETPEDFGRATALGFTAFQGYFFCRPQIVKGKSLPASSLAVMQALQEVMAAAAISDVENVMMQDVTLSYRLLTHINSAAFGLRRKVESIRQALGLLGLSNIRQWLSLLLLADAGKEQPPELVRVVLLRGKVLEGIAELRQPDKKSDYFLLGLFSLLDVILGMHMEDALAKLCLPAPIHQGLTDVRSEYGQLLELVKAMEQGDWSAVGAKAMNLDIQCGDLMGVQIRALYWVSENSKQLSA